MKIMFLGNNRIALKILKHLKYRREEVVALGVHPRGDANMPIRKEMITIAGLGSKQIFLGNQLQKTAVLERIRKLKPDIALMMNFGYIVRPEFLKLFPGGVINLHTGYLPYNRGQFPNVWSIIDRVPAGVTLHYVDAGVDTGAIISQVRVRTECFDTGASLLVKLQTAAVNLFQETWPKIKSGKAKGKKQNLTAGSFHRTSDVCRVDRIDLRKKYIAGDLINVLRARTFPPYNGAYFEENGKRVYMRLSLYPKDL